MITESAANPTPTFELLDPAVAQTGLDLLGVWATIPLSSADAIAFNTDSQISVDAPLWRANLAADFDQAQRQLVRGDAMLNANKKNLAMAMGRLDKFIEIQMPGQAFDITTQARLARPEAELAHLLRTLPTEEPSIAFSPDKPFAKQWGQITGQLQAFIESLHRYVAHYAWIETRVQDEVIARTTVGWIGDVNTIWRIGLEPEQTILHQRTLALALHSRDMLIQTLTAASRFAMKLSMLLSTPASSILLLAAAWRFINCLLVNQEATQSRRN